MSTAKGKKKAKGYYRSGGNGIAINVYLPVEDYKKMLKAYYNDNPQNKTPTLWVRDTIRNRTKEIEKKGELKDVPPEWLEKLGKKETITFGKNRKKKKPETIETSETIETPETKSEPEEVPEVSELKKADFLSVKIISSEKPKEEKKEEKKKSGKLGFLGL